MGVGVRVLVFIILSHESLVLARKKPSSLSTRENSSSEDEESASTEIVEPDVDHYANTQNVTTIKNEDKDKDEEGTSFNAMGSWTYTDANGQSQTHHWKGQLPPGANIMPHMPHIHQIPLVHPYPQNTQSQSQFQASAQNYYSPMINPYYPIMNPHPYAGYHPNFQRPMRPIQPNYLYNNYQIPYNQQSQHQYQVQSQGHGQGQMQGQVQVQGQLQGQQQGQVQGQIQGQGQGQLQGQFQGQYQGQPQRQAQGQLQAQSQRQSQLQTHIERISGQSRQGRPKFKKRLYLRRDKSTKSYNIPLKLEV